MGGSYGKWPSALTLPRLLPIGLLAALLAAPAAEAETINVTTSADSGAGSLRAAITASNASTTENDVIAFQTPLMGGNTISLATALPNVTDTVSIDGCSATPAATQPCVGLRPASQFDFNALRVDSAPTVTIEGLAISNAIQGVSVEGGLSSLLFRISGCWVGLRLDGSAEGNQVGLVLRSSGALVGGTGAGDGNVFAANTDFGIAIRDGGTAEGHSITGNLIGTDSSGAPLGSGTGISIAPSGIGEPVTGVTIGGATAASENVISHNETDAISINGDEVEDVEVHRNRGIGNGTSDEHMFIELLGINGPGSSFPGPNGSVNAPTIIAASTESASGLAEPNARIRVYGVANDSRGRIDRFVGQTDADGAGAWTLSYAPLPLGQRIVASQTPPGSPEGTSELTAPRAYADVTDPETTITARPRPRSRDRTPTFAFTASEFAIFRCRLDARPLTNCASPETYRVKRGRHTFRVFAIDAAGNADPSPATTSFRVRRKRRRR